MAKHRTKQLRIWHILSAVAATALLISVDPATLPMAAKTTLFVLGLTAAAISCFMPASWLKVTAWSTVIFPIFPPLGVLLTWLAASVALSHVPRANLDDPGTIGGFVEICRCATFLSLSLVPSMALLSLSLVAFNLVISLIRKNPYTSENALLCTFSVLSWSAMIVFFYCDPGGLVYWFFD
jgi:hypothetical protein